MRESRIRALVLHAQYTTRLSYYDDWLDAFRKDAGFEVQVTNIATSDAAKQLGRALNDVDAVILLHSTNGDTVIYLEPLVPILADRRVPLISFVGNEVNLPGSSISDKRRVLRAIRPDFIATQLLEEAGNYLFGDLVKNRVVAIPHALNPEVYRSERPLDDRPIDIGVRAAKYLPHLGDDDRNRIVERFAQLGREGRIVADISNARFDRAGWAKFLNRCKGAVATEAGSWFLERDDKTVNAIRARVMSEARGIVIANDSPLRRLGHKLPWRVREWLRLVLRSNIVNHESLINEDLPHDEIHRDFFAGKPRAPVYGKCISSRHFDAIGSKTCQIMFRGRFNDILKANQHYLALDDDFGNLADVLARFADPLQRRQIVEAAHALAMDGHTYAHRTRQVYTTMQETRV